MDIALRLFAASIAGVMICEILFFYENFELTDIL